MPKVCQLITRLILGGAQRIALETAASLAREGWEVELWSGPQTGPEGTLRDEACARGLRVQTVQHLVREVSPLRDLRAFNELRTRLRRERFDVVHTHSSKAGIVGRLAASSAGVPLRIHSIHGWAMTPDSSAPARLLYTGLERLAAGSTHTLLAVSHAVRKAGLAAGIGRPEQYAVIHGGIRPPALPDREARARARHKLGLPQDAIVLGTVGRLDDAKDPLGALRAALPLLHRAPNVRLLFIGDGKLRLPLRRAVEDLGCSGQVVLAGLQRDAFSLLGAFDIFFLSSRWEGFPLAVIEAMASALPVVAYDVAGIHEAVEEGKTGFLLPPGQEALWRDGLQRLVEDAHLRRTMGLAGRERALSHFGMERMLQEILELYRRLLAHSPSIKAAPTDTLPRDEPL